MLDILNITYDPKEAIEYFNNVQLHFSEYRWEMDQKFIELHDGNDGDKILGLYGYSLTTPLESIHIPYVPHNTNHVTHLGATQKWYNTNLIFGFSKKIKDTFAGIEKMSIFCHPPGVHVGAHIDMKTEYTIQFPIVTNSEANFIILDKSYNPRPGQVSLFYSGRDFHSTTNYGNTDRVHLNIKCRLDSLEYNKKLSGQL